jgi:hypothetical protein
VIGEGGIYSSKTPQPAPIPISLWVVPGGAAQNVGHVLTQCGLYTLGKADLRELLSLPAARESFGSSCTRLLSIQLPLLKFSR